MTRKTSGVPMGEEAENAAASLVTLNTQNTEKQEYFTATQRQMIWRRCKKHKLALIGGILLALFLLTVVFSEFIAVYGPRSRNVDYILGPPQRIRFRGARGTFTLRPHVFGTLGMRNPETLRMEYEENPEEAYPIRFLVRGEPYKLMGFIPGSIHLFGVREGRFHLFGTDELGRDLFSRTVYATRTSMTIGLMGILIAFVLGLILGGISGYFGGWVDDLLQRLIEFIRSIPTLPLWMALAAAIPREWSPLKVYFMITVILGFVGWTGLARRVRGKLLSLRDEDFVTAARIAGAGDMRIIARHMLPSFSSYIIVDITLSFPAMILSETSLSFLGLGLRAPVTSWGVLLQAAQNVRTIAQSPWLMIPAGFFVLAVLAFSFVGDGLRDAADPYTG